MITFSAHHNLTLADLSPEQIVPVVNTWTNLYAAHVSPSSPLASAFTSRPLPPQSSHAQISPPAAQYRWMQIFENKGAAMGCSNPHPHGQVWTTTGLPEEPRLELTELIKYRREHPGHNLLVDYASLESSHGGGDAGSERVICKNAAFIALCPWWAVWPYETMILPLAHKRALVDFDDRERLLLAQAIAEVTRRYDNLFETSFPYSMGLHQAPVGPPDDASLELGQASWDDEIEASQFHIHFYPPLLRSASVRKFLVG